MAITEAERHALYKALEDSIGMAPANTLMEHLPPVGWADVATKRDLDQLELRLDLRLEARLGAEIGGLRSELSTESGSIRVDMAGLESRVMEKLVDVQRNLFLGLLASQATFAAVIITAVR